MSSVPPASPRKRRSERYRTESARQNDLAASRNWKRANPDLARRHSFDTCACGRRKRRGADECRVCRDARFRERDRQVVDLRCDGLTNAEIARKLDVSPQTVADAIRRLRGSGIEVPASPHYLAGRS